MMMMKRSWQKPNLNLKCLTRNVGALAIPLWRRSKDICADSGYGFPLEPFLDDHHVTNSQQVADSTRNPSKKRNNMRPKKKRKTRTQIQIPEAPWLKGRMVTQEEAITSLRELFTPEERMETFTKSAEEISKMSEEEVLQAIEGIEEPTIKPSPSSRQTSPNIKPKRKPASINRQGRRPDYSHGLIGLEPGDKLVFCKNQKIEARIVDHTYGVEINGQIFNGIVPSAQYAYKISNII